MTQVVWCFLIVDALVLPHGSLVLLEPTHNPTWEVELNGDKDGPGSILQAQASMYFWAQLSPFYIKS